MKKIKVKPTAKQLEIIRRHWKCLQELQAEFTEKIRGVEISMEKQTGIKGIEFFMSDNEYVGVGNVNRTMELIHL